MKLLKPHSVSLTNRWRECQSRDYDSRRVVANFSDGGSNPPRSTIQGFEEHLSIKVFNIRKTLRKMKLFSKRHKKLNIFLISFLALIALVIGFFVYIYNQAYHKVTIECGSSVSACDLMKNGDSKASFVDQSLDIASMMPGEYSVEVKSGFYIHKIKIVIRDTVAPTASANNVCLSLGDSVGPEAFVSDVNDATPVTVAFASNPDTSKVGNSQVSILLTDTSSNLTNLTASLDVVPFKTKVEVEAGSKSVAKSDFSLGEDDFEVVTDLASISMNSVSDNKIAINYAGKEYVATLSVVDTVAPDVKFKNIDGYMGADYTAADFAVSSNDATKISYSFEEDYDKASYDQQNLVVIATDEGGNSVKGEVTLKLKDDTEPPILDGVHDIYVYQGNSVSYKDGITVSDNCVEKIKFEVDAASVNTDEVGTYPVTYTVTDVGGHTVSASCNVIVQEREYDMDEINAAADAILAEIITDDMTDRDKAWAIYSYIRGHMYFIDDYVEGSYIKACYDGVVCWKGDCYVYACTAQTLLTRAGVKNMMISKIPTRRHHYWNLVDVDGTGWYHYDTTPRAEENHPTFFLKTDAEMMEYSHAHYNCFNYDREAYPEIN